MEEIGPDDDWDETDTWGGASSKPAEAESPVGRGRTMLDDFPGDDVPLSREPGGSNAAHHRAGDDDGPDFDDILARLEGQERERSGRAGGVAEDDDLFGADDDLPSALREGPRRQGGKRKRPPAWASWATAVVVVLAGALGALYFLRNNVVAMMPESEAVYNALGIPLNWPGLGLTLHEPKPVVTRELVDNEEVVVVRGFINNVSEVDRPVPALRLALHDADGDMVQQMVAPPPTEMLEPGGTTAFRMVMRNTLPQAKTFEVTFTDRPSEPMMAPPMETSSSQ